MTESPITCFPFTESSSRRTSVRGQGGVRAKSQNGTSLDIRTWDINFTTRTAVEKGIITSLTKIHLILHNPQPTRSSLAFLLMAALPVKVVIIGDGGSGKTSLLSAFASNKFPEFHVPTVFDNCSRTMMVDGRGVVLNMWDTAGQEDYDTMRPISYPGTDVFLVCFSIDSTTSYNNVKQKWIPEIRSHANKVPFILVGLKMDMRTDDGTKFISRDYGEKLKTETRAPNYVECSAKTQEGVRQVFEEAIRAIFREINNKKKKQCSLL